MCVSTRSLLGPPPALRRLVLFPDVSDDGQRVLLNVKFKTKGARHVYASGVSEIERLRGGNGGKGAGLWEIDLGGRGGAWLHVSAKRRFRLA